VVWVGLALALVSAVVVNWAYTREHDAVVAVPPMSPRHPLAAARALLRTRPWLTAFGAETGGWLVYLAALRLAPLALVQAVSATGIAVLAIAGGCGGHPLRLPRREQLAIILSIAGLAVLGLSMVGSQPSDHPPDAVHAAIWLGACGAAAAALTVARTRITHAATLGLAAGLLFSGGDLSAKLVVWGGPWLATAAPLVAFYALGSLQLQGAFQHGDAVTAAGIATLTTNAVPIAAGVVLLHEALPAGTSRVLQIAAFALVVVGGGLLTDPRARDSAATIEADGPRRRSRA
jgi:drug/metabolite transporter (DMT)-like permease